MAPLPALGTADAFDARTIHEIGCRGSGEAVGTITAGRFIPEAQRQAEPGEAVDQPLTRLPIGLASLAWGIGPDQGIGEAAGVEHRLATTGTAHQLEQAIGLQPVPMPGPLPLMSPQREPGTIPAVKPQHG